MGYNGWSNWETWNVALWIDNDEPMYRDKMRFIRTAATLSGNTVEAFVRQLMPNGTPDFTTPKEFGTVDWDEIAQAWQDEADE